MNTHPGSIPKAALDFIPFTEEAVSKWSDDVDILAFIRALLDQECVSVDEFGNKKRGNYSEVADHFFRRDRRAVDAWINRFSQPRDGGGAIPGRTWFENSGPFGKAVKYFIAWKEVVANVLADSEFFSIIHLLETELDISSSFLLASDLYYKQAFQVLRGYMENLVLPVFFSEFPTEFSEWKKNSYRVPNMRGDKGLLPQLTKKAIISAHLSDRISATYADLNGYIHSGEKTMTFKGVFEGQWQGFVFKEEDFLKWCDYISESVKIGIELLVINLKHWRSKSTGKILCAICHGDEFNIVDDEFGGGKRKLYTCIRCGNEMRFRVGADN